MEKKYSVVGIGAANVDTNWQSKEAIRYRDSNPGYSRVSVGGVTRNILENLARLGESTSLVTTIGDDPNGKMILQECRDAGIDISHVILREGKSSSAYTCILDETGDMMLALSDMEILREMRPEDILDCIPLFCSADAVACDGCLPREVLETLLSETKGRTPVFVDPVSIAYARNIKPLIGRFYGIKPNIYELATLTETEIRNQEDIERATDILLNRGTGCVAVSLGEKGCYYADNRGNRFYDALPPIKEMKNASGAGDSFTAGLIYGYLKHMPAEEQIRFAMACGSLTIQSENTVHPGISAALVEEYLGQSGE